METAEYALMDAAEQDMWWYRALHAQVLAALADPALPGTPWRADAAGAGNVPAHGTISAETNTSLLLDAGCGTGGMLARLRALAPDAALLGLEYFPAAARRAAAKACAPVVAGTVNALPFPDACCTALLSLDVLSHAAVEPDLALAEMRRVLRPGGRLVLNLPAYGWMASAHDRHVRNARRFTAGGATALLRATGFQAVTTRYWNTLLFPLMVVQRKLLARGDAASDVKPFSPWLEAQFRRVTEWERRLQAAGLRFPAGGSVLVIAQR